MRPCEGHAKEFGLPLEAGCMRVFRKGARVAIWPGPHSHYPLPCHQQRQCEADQETKAACWVAAEVGSEAEFPSV